MTHFDHTPDPVAAEMHRLLTATTDAGIRLPEEVASDPFAALVVCARPFAPTETPAVESISYLSVEEVDQLVNGVQSQLRDGGVRGRPDALRIAHVTGR